MGYDKTSLAALSLVIFVNAYGVTFIFSFIGFMIVDLGEAKTRNEAGYVAGYVTSAYFLGRMLSSGTFSIQTIARHKHKLFFSIVGICSR